MRFVRGTSAVHRKADEFATPGNSGLWPEADIGRDLFCSGGGIALIKALAGEDNMRRGSGYR